MKQWIDKSIRSFSDDKFSFGNLYKNQEFMFALSHAQLFYKSDVIYSLIPKNSCTSLRLNIALENGVVRSEKDFDWIHSNYNVFQASVSEAVRCKLAFVILRCPFRRLVSGFLDKFLRLESDASSLLDIADIDKDSFDFSSFVDLISEKDEGDLNIHWRPQSCFTLFDNYDFYFSLERFDVFEDWFLDTFNRKFIPADGLVDYFNRPFTKVKIYAASSLSLNTLLKLKGNGVVPFTSCFYNTYLIHKVSNIYARDIHLYKKNLDANDLLFNI